VDIGLSKEKIKETLENKELSAQSVMVLIIENNKKIAEQLPDLVKGIVTEELIKQIRS
jgi:hypothetical protein